MQDNTYQKKIVTLPNCISLFRLLLIPLFVWLSLAKKEHGWAVGVLALSAVSDVADGWIARHFHMESDVGRILDPFADKLTQAAMALTLIYRYPIMLAVLILFAVKETLMVGLGYLYMKRTGIVNNAHWYGKASAIVQYVVMAVLLINTEVRPFTVYVLVALCMATHILSVVMYSIFYIRAIREPENRQRATMRPIDWSAMVMYLLMLVALFMLMFTSGDSYLHDVLPKCIYLFLRFAAIVSTIGIPAFFVGEKIPRRWFEPVKAPFTCYAWEDEGRIYEKLGIRFWKTHVPDMSKYMAKAFAKQGNMQRDPEHLKKLVQETCSAELLHWWLVLLSPAFAIFMEQGGIFAMVMYIFGNLVSIVIQRYNRPRIMKIIQRIEKRKCADC